MRRKLGAIGASNVCGVQRPNVLQQQAQLGQVRRITTRLDTDDWAPAQDSDLGPHEEGMAGLTFLDDLHLLQVSMQMAPRNERLPP